MFGLPLSGQLNPLGQSARLPALDWPTIMYVFCDYYVFRTPDFTGPDGPQPTWTDSTTGMTLKSNGRLIKSAAVDAVNRDVYQYAFTVTNATSDAGGDIYRRVNPGAWASILTEAQAKTVAGVAGGTLARIRWMATNKSTAGRVYAVLDVLATKLMFLTSEDYGDTWSAVQVSTGLYEIPRNFIADGNRVIIGGNVGASSKGGFWYTTDGVIWSKYTNIGTNLLWISGLTDSYAYSASYSTGGGIYDLVKLTLSNGAYTVLQDAQNMGSEGKPDSLFVYSDDVQKLLKYTAPGVNTLCLTSDGWDSYSTVELDVSPDAIAVRTVGGYQDDLTKLVLGEQGTEYTHVVYALKDGSSPTGRAGDNPGTPPYTDSIPQPGESGALCVGGGIQIVT